MANPEHVQIVKQGAEAIRRWLQENWRVLFDLSEANLTGADLGGADLSGANLSRADLRDANLSGADLGGTDLGWVAFSGVDLSGADLSGASLFAANLFGAEFSGADLKGANLYGAHVELTILAAADLGGATCGETVFVDVDLSSVKGLETVRHVAPSSIGVDTLYRSKGKIPETFLRGCGVPETLIVQLPSLLAAESDAEFYSCFISYSHHDKSFAQRLHDALQKCGIRCWLDEKQMLPGDDVHEQVDRGIRLWDKVLLCASKHSLTSWWVDNEIESAFKKEQKLMKQHGKKVLTLIPLDLDRYIFDHWENGKKGQVLSRRVADFTGWESDDAKFEQQLASVIQALRADDQAREPAPKPRL